MNTRLVWIVTIVALIAIVGVGAFFLATRSGEASAGDAVDDFRDSGAGSAREAPGLPPAGVYEYDVTGSETIVQGPVEITRAFPESSPAIVTHSETGYQWEWRISSDRTETLTYVLDDRGASAAAGRSELAVAGISSNVDREWSPPPLRFPLEPAVGDRWNESAVGSDGTMLDIESRITGTDTLEIDGSPTDVSVLESTLAFSGDTTGVVEETFYFVPESGVLARYVSEEDFRGGGELRSTWDARLVSLEPEV